MKILSTDSLTSKQPFCLGIRPNKSQTINSSINLFNYEIKSRNSCWARNRKMVTAYGKMLS